MNLLFNEPLVRKDKSFDKVFSSYVIDNIKESNISVYFQLIKNAVYETIKDFKQKGNAKLNFVIDCEFFNQTSEEYVKGYFNREAEEIMTMNNFDILYENIEHEFNEWLDSFQERGSGFTFSHIERATINLTKTIHLRASSYFPHDLGLIRSVLNIQNNDMKCFTWSILASLYPAKNHISRVSNYTKYENMINMEGIDYPVKIKDIPKFEKQNEQLSINVFALENSKDVNSLYPLYISNYKDRKIIDLLYLEKDGNTHYCLIKDIGTLLTKTKHKGYVCRNCMTILSTNQALENHQEKCLNNKFCKTIMPKLETKIKFTKYEYKSRLPVVIYCDFEATNKKVNYVKGKSSSLISEQTVNSFGMYIKSDYTNIYTSQYYNYVGVDAEQKFIETIILVYNDISKKLTRASNAYKNVILTKPQQQEYDQATNCYICNVSFSQAIKIREHNHMNGKYRGAACQSCNTQEGKVSKRIPVFFHNGSGYDFHFIISELMKYEDKNNKVEVLAKTSENYISITFGNIYRKLVFLDSNRFMQKSLEGIAESLKKEDFIIFDKEFRNLYNKDLLKQKGVYPYEYIDSIEKFYETQLPPLEEFYSHLKQQNISEEDYKHAQLIWKTFNCQTFLDYHNIYLKTDVLILADSFEKYREFFLTNHQIDPCYCYSAPGLTWECGLKYTKIELDPITDVNMLQMIESGIRGGYSGVLGKRYVKANNKYLKDYNEKEKSNYLLYLDANNLYGWAMCQPLPTNDFQWEESNYNWRNPPNNRGCILEVDLEYTNNLKFKTVNFPLAPEKLNIKESELSDYQLDILKVETKKVGNVAKLILNLKNKNKYIIHHKLLKYYEELGLKVSKVHRVISFNQDAWLKKYIDFNTNERTKAKSDFEKDLWKLMNNAFYGKTMENIRGRINLKLTMNPDEALKLFSKPNFKSVIPFKDNLIAVLNNIPSIKFDKPIYLGMCILDYSKLLMYDFYYETINNLWNKNEIVGFDTDSFFLNIETNDIYKDMEKIIHDLDTSAYPNNSSLYSSKNKKVIGKFKDELNGKLMSELVFLRSKAYAYKTIDEEYEKKLKGISRATIKKNVTFEEYKNSILKPYTNILTKEVYSLNSFNHKMFVKMTHKKAISPFDDKRYILDNAIETFPFGYEDLYFT